jgi:hypothetical protein
MPAGFIDADGKLLVPPHDPRSSVPASKPVSERVASKQPALSYRSTGVQCNLIPSTEGASSAQSSARQATSSRASASTSGEALQGSSRGSAPSGLGGIDLHQIVIYGRSLAQIIQEVREDAVRETMEHISQKVVEIFSNNDDNGEESGPGMCLTFE